MSITCQVESIDEVIDEMRPLWDLHWNEIALDKNRVPLNPDVQSFRLMEEMNGLHIATVRDEKKLVGYHVTVLRTHLHYRHSLTAYVDMYFLHPDYRQGMAGIKMFKFVEDQFKKLGVERIYQSTKKHKDLGRLFERLGYKVTERIFTKWIGD